MIGRSIRPYLFRPYVEDWLPYWTQWPDVYYRYSSHASVNRGLFSGFLWRFSFQWRFPPFFNKSDGLNVIYIRNTYTENDFYTGLRMYAEVSHPCIKLKIWDSTMSPFHPLSSFLYLLPPLSLSLSLAPPKAPPEVCALRIAGFRHCVLFSNKLI